jgi:hypothetical protein
MTELSGNDFVLSDPGISGDLGMIHCPYRALSFAYYPSSGDFPTRSYFPTAADQLLAATAIENSRARVGEFPRAGCKARHPVRAVEQHDKGCLPAVCNRGIF